MPNIEDKPIQLVAANVPRRKESDSSDSDDLPVGFPSPPSTPEPTFHKNLLICGMIAFVTIPLAGAALYFVFESLKNK